MIRGGLAVVLVGLVVAGGSAAQPATVAREQAVLEARAGQVDAAIGKLRAMLRAGTDDGLVAADLLTLLQQAGRPHEALAVLRGTRADALPS
jgi:hypothetical protein